MNESQNPLQLLDLDEAGAAGERLQRWAQAFEAWLAQRRSHLAATTAQISYTAWREFLALTRKPPWDATVPDVEAYVAALTKRKLRPATIKLRLTGLARFYKYCQVNNVDPQCPGGFNPVAGVRRPDEVKYEKANYLSRKDEAALLAAIRRDPSPMGKRDYALFLMLLRTGWKSGDVCRLRWGSLGAAAEDAARGPGSGSALCCSGEALPQEVWQAIREYLQASGRWEGIQPQEYVFAPSRAPLKIEARERAQDWDSSRPLRKDGLRHLLRLHAGRAGLKAEAITTHTLRHTFAMRQLEAGASAEALGAMLHMQEAANVKVYASRLAQNPKRRLRARRPAQEEIWPGLPRPLTGERSWPPIGSVSRDVIGEISRPSHSPSHLPSLPLGSAPVPSRGPCRAWRRNHLALKHGFYARYLPEFEWLAELGFRPKGLDGAVVRWRVVMQRAAILGNDVTTLKDGLRVLKILGWASVRLGKALKLRKELRDEEWEQYLRIRSDEE